MSDWVKTEDGWKQTSGNGVGRDEINEVKQELSQIAEKTKNTFSNLVSIGFGTDYTCPSDGMVTVGGYGEGTYYSLMVNGIAIFTQVCFDSNRGYIDSWRVNKGDVIKINGTDSTVVNTRLFRGI